MFAVKTSTQVSSKNLFEIRDVMGHVMSYVDEDDRFRMRKLNRIFYSLYYGQTAVHNSRRALFLTQLGRSFTRVTELEISLDKVRGSTLKYITSQTFGRLTKLSLKSTAQRVTFDTLSGLHHSGIRELKVDLSQPADMSAISEVRFPELRKLSVAIRGFISVKPYRPLRLSPHTKLKEMNIDHLFLDDSFFQTLTQESFPQLRILKIGEDSCFLTGLCNEDLREQCEGVGINLEFFENTDSLGGIVSLEREIIKLM